MPRPSISVTLPPKCIEWLDQQVQDRIYHNRSHAVEYVILMAMEKAEAD